MDNMNLPEDASCSPELKPHNLPDGAYIKNPFPGKKLLTFDESLQCIHLLSSMMRIDYTVRKH